MNQLKERLSVSQPTGIAKSFQLLKSTQTKSASLSPKEIFLIKEKSMRIKTMILMIINNLAWILVLISPQEPEFIQEPLPIEKNYKIVKLPAQIFSEGPTLQKKIHVILKHSSSNYQTSGYLRKVENDTHGTTGFKATIEIPKSDLEKLNSLTSHWLIYPYFKKQEPKSIKSRSFHEVIF